MPTLSPIEEIETSASAPEKQLPSPLETQKSPKLSQSPSEKEITESEVNPEEDEDFDPTYGFQLNGLIENVEPPWDYLHGGHHPVHLEESLGEHEQYRVIHKLGTGGFANVWLCRVLGEEPTKYVAVKILMAHLSGESRELENVHRLQELANTDPLIEMYCLLPIETFEIDGPNGHHQCFVYPVAGQTVKEIFGTAGDPHEYLRDLSRQTAEAMAALHRHGICHGGMSSPNRNLN